MARNKQRQSRHRRVRAKISGIAARPRLSVFRSLSHIYVQLIDDESGRTLISATSREVPGKSNKTQLAALVGKLAAEKALKAGISEVTFDRGGYKYHGRIKELADAARSAGLKF
ncbi:MAG: 50S ribosomal protein L18 [Candidatus Doudnabacteria bacterium RIFCSPHIGHO2_12_FULL_48_11]|uniref:Large ribosomal subunit protein uL18 n=1 Tax=Candidatus Doudnabacteria bacterium RIFCSPHIGHO2_01_FULL_46_24 TaxID=1817825 RepID=A0A1F5NVA4_9BACT|nr:ribosomal protein L18 [uncultured bacterium]OGE81462.1 MAG: 50S ribosomal protein L18 [Candidatus Doudnabacteria bacterium RIFCSPHIGHO2_01_FULL_46_24]OGE95920.1 MAG: 50S ribosomal protein L18 [Candidatus Doudnabacteria bacterium RIFCSPHIGHO2_12_FULL_48_11]